MYEVIIEPAAAQEMKELAQYIVDVFHEPEIALRIYKNIKSAINSLSEMPKRHSVMSVEPYTSKQVRVISVNNYCVFYVVNDSETRVYVLHVLYKRRDWKNIL